MTSPAQRQHLAIPAKLTPQRKIGSPSGCNRQQRSSTAHAAHARWEGGDRPPRHLHLSFCSRPPHFRGTNLSQATMSLCSKPLTPSSKMFSLPPPTVTQAKRPFSQASSRDCAVCLHPVLPLRGVRATIFATIAICDGQKSISISRTGQ